MDEAPLSGHEPASIATRRVLRLGACVAATVMALCALLYWLVRHEVMPNEAQIAARASPIPAPPRLQPDPGPDLALMRHEEEVRLSGYAWLDDEHSAARIPISRAMAIAVQGGAPKPRPSVRPPDGLLDKVGFDQLLGSQVPLDATFRDSDGAALRIGDLLDGKPVLIVPNYYECAHLCGIVRSALAFGISGSGLKAGTDFQVLLISMSPDEGPAQARAAQRADAAAHPAAGVSQWRYLTGPASSIAELTHSVGFRYFVDVRNGEYTHDAGLVVLTAKGIVAQYLFGARFAGQTLRLALVTASQGHIGNLIDHFLLLCCDYDSSTGRYTVTIRRVLGWLALITVLALGGLIAFLRRREPGRRGGPS